jgi:hypothetical protein
MIPNPPDLYQCPHCEALYTRGSVRSGNNFGASVWSDGVQTGGMMGKGHDPIILCGECKKFFALFKAWIPNEWGFDLPKDKIYGRSQPMSVENCQLILNDQTLMYQLWSRPPEYLAEIGVNPDDEQERQTRLRLAQYRIRHMIWEKLNDEIRHVGYARFPKEKRAALLENARLLLPLIQADEYDESYLIWRAELHRNLGEFGKSLKTLRLITEKSLQKSKRKMIFLNLMGNRKLVRLWHEGNGFFENVGMWWSWMWSIR